MKRLRSRILGRTVWVDVEHGTATTDDGVTSTRDELAALRAKPAALLAALHATKKVFGGTIVTNKEVTT